MSKSLSNKMVADENLTNATSSSRAPKFEESNFLKFKKFFTSFLMRHERAHLVLTENKPSHIHDVDPTIPANSVMDEAQVKRLTKQSTRSVDEEKQNCVLLSDGSL